jgi:DUF1680 family protein
MTDPDLRSVRITGGFWGQRLERNAREAIFYQWEQLERTRCIDNFRLAAGLIEGFREGMFFADSDAYKWLDAASRILAANPDPALKQRVDEFIALLEAAQMEDGYLFTYNQLLFPGQRWVNLRTEHELYCHGHLIEAGVAHHLATGEARLLNLVRRSADLLVREFMNAPVEQADGHEEIEIALIRLYRVTGEAPYLELARHLLERRGQVRAFPLGFLRQALRTGCRLRSSAKRRKAYRRAHPESASFKLPAGNKPKVPLLAPLRAVHSMVSGRFLQQHTPLRRQTEPVGHAVCFTYLQTGAAMLSRETGDRALLSVLERTWEHMVTRRMYVTGGLGSVPLVEGFGRDYELDPEFGYAETCAAIGSLLWNHEMALLTNQPRYDDLFEWQLYNAASVGIGMDVRSYFYNNPLTCRGGITRAPWYFIPCCPSNLSRTWAALGQYAYRSSGRTLHLSHYLTSEIHLDWGTLRVDAGLPWSGDVRLTLQPSNPGRVTLSLRLPGWSDTYALQLNGAPLQPDSLSEALPVLETACGYAPHAARVVTISRAWSPGDVLDLTLGMPLRLHRQHRKIARCGGMDALSRGPLVYCLESVDNPGDLFRHRVQRDSLGVVDDPALLGGIRKIEGRSTQGVPLTFIPYMLWGNRGLSQMTVFFESDGATQRAAR